MAEAGDSENKSLQLQAYDEFLVACFCQSGVDDAEEHLPAWHTSMPSAARGKALGYRVLQDGSPESAIKCFSALNKIDGHPTYKFFHTILSEFCALKDRQALDLANAHERPGYLIHVPAWGQSYAENLVNYMLPSLLAAGNLPYASKHWPVQILIHTDRQTASFINASPVIDQIRKHAGVEIATFSDRAFFFMEQAGQAQHVRPQHLKYDLYALCQVLALQFAQLANAHLSFFSADIVFADNTLGRAVDLLRDGRKAVAINVFRSSLLSLQPVLERFRNPKTATLEVDPASAVRLQVEHIHTAALRRVVAETTEYWNPKAQMIFPVEKGYIVRSIHYHPFLIASDGLSRISRLDYAPVDSNAFATMFPDPTTYDTEIAVQSDAASLAVIELSEPDVERVEDAQQFRTVDEMQQIQKRYLSRMMTEPLHRHFLKNRLLFSTDPAATLETIDSIDADYIAACLQENRQAP